MAREQIVNVPLDPDVKRRLEEQADANGRATAREAAMIIMRAVCGAGREGGLK